MYPCPSCKAKGIRVLGKWWSVPSLPAKCTACARQCCAPVRDSGAVLVLSAVGVTLAGFTSIAFGSAVPVLLGVALSIAAFLWKWHTQPLVPLSPQQISTSRKADSLGLLALVLLSLFQ
jgi:hypothetical protein